MQKRFFYALAVAVTLSLPSFVSAQTTVATYLTLIGSFLSNYVIPLIVAIAVLFFFWGITKSFIISGASEEGREEGKRIALWGILALVFILSLWGITNVVISGFGIGDGRIICPDYMPNCNR